MLRTLLRSLALLAIAFALAALPTHASQNTLVLEPEATEIAFFVEATGHDVHGLLELTYGEITFDPETGVAGGELHIDARLASTGNKKCDKKMHKAVLESAKHPLISFSAERLNGTPSLDGKSEFKVIGTVTLLGQQHPLELTTMAEIHDGAVDATITFPVPYADWGLRNPSMLVLRVAKVVDVTVHVTGRLDVVAQPVATN